MGRTPVRVRLEPGSSAREAVLAFDLWSFAFFTHAEKIQSSILGKGVPADPKSGLLSVFGTAAYRVPSARNR